MRKPRRKPSDCCRHPATRRIIGHTWKCSTCGELFEYGVSRTVLDAEAGPVTKAELTPSEVEQLRARFTRKNRTQGRLFG